MQGSDDADSWSQKKMMKKSKDDESDITEVKMTLIYEMLGAHELPINKPTTNEDSKKAVSGKDDLYLHL